MLQGEKETADFIIWQKARPESLITGNGMRDSASNVFTVFSSEGVALGPCFSLSAEKDLWFSLIYLICNLTHSPITHD